MKYKKIYSRCTYPRRQSDLISPAVFRLLQQRLGSPSPNTEDLHKNSSTGDPSASPSRLFFSSSFLLCSWSSTVFVNSFFFVFVSSSSTNSPFLEPASPDVVQSGLLFFVLFCFQASSHQSSTSSSSSFSSDLFHFFSRIHTSSFSLFTNITTKRWQTLLGTCSLQN